MAVTLEFQGESSLPLQGCVGWMDSDPVTIGLGITSEGGFGVHAALDVLASDSAWWRLGIGLH